MHPLDQNHHKRKDKTIVSDASKDETVEDLYARNGIVSARTRNSPHRSLDGSQCEVKVDQRDSETSHQVRRRIQGH